MAVNTTVQVTMPQMGESVTEGTVLEWHKQEGDTVEADEILVEISTDKVDAEVPSPAAGTVVKIHVAEGDTVEVGAVLAEIAADQRRSAAAASGPSDGGDDAPPGRPPGTEADGGEIVDIVTPAGGESVTEGTILEWAVKVGDAVDDGETIVEISTDKVDMELPAPAGGHDHRDPRRGGRHRHGRPGHRAHAGRRRRGRADAAPRRGTGAARRGTDAERAAPSPTTPRSPPSPPASPPPRASTSARVAGTGPRRAHHQGRRARAKNGDASGAPPPPATADGSATLLKGGAAMLARYMDESRSIPTATSFRTITVTAMDARRKQLKDARPEGLLHPPDRLRDRPGRAARHAGHGPPLRRGATASRTASTTARQPRHRRRRREEGRHAAR